MTVNKERSNSVPPIRYDWRMNAFLVALVAIGLVLLSLVLDGQVWRAVAYGVVALFAFLIALAAYFWGSLLFGGVLEVLSRQRTPVPWDLDSGQSLSVPEHNLDPGLELLAAGMLVYQGEEAMPRPHFRKVPLADARAFRPFIVARTGGEREHRFLFKLSDQSGVTRFSDEFRFSVHDDAQIVMPAYCLKIERPQVAVGKQWTLRVQSGVTVVTTFRFRFVEAARSSANGSQTLETPQGDMSQLLDETVKRDMVTRTHDVVLEVV